MKKLLFGALLLCASFMVVQRSEAQVRVGVNVNIGNQPAWRVPGYNYVEYYYLPEIETYYDVNRRQFIYISNGRWVFSNNLPYRYRSYDLYSGYKVVVNRPNAYLQYESDRMKYRNKNFKKNNKNKFYNGHDNRRRS